MANSSKLLACTTTNFPVEVFREAPETLSGSLLELQVPGEKRNEILAGRSGEELPELPKLSTPSFIPTLF
jgi:hypothetical protein